MKQLKSYERYINNNIFNTDKIKKYTVTTDGRLFYFLDSITKLDKNNDTVDIKSLQMYSIEDNFNEWLLNDYNKVHFSYFDNILFSSDNYEESLSFYKNLIDTHKDANKYNL